MNLGQVFELGSWYIVSFSKQILLRGRGKADLVGRIGQKWT